MKKKLKSYPKHIQGKLKLDSTLKKKRKNIPFAGGVRGTGAGYGANGTGIAFLI